MTLIDLPDNPIPDGAKTGIIKTPDGTDLRYAHWASVGGRRRGTVTLLQGRAECIEKYFEVIEELRSRGFAVIAFDWRGQGGSKRLLHNPRKGHIRDFREYRDDLLTVLKNVSLTEYPGPHFALAHSTGAAVLLSCSERLRTMLDRAVLSSPLLGLPEAHGSEGHKRVPKYLRWLSYRWRPKRQPTGYSTGARNPMERVAFPLAAVLSWLGFGWTYVPGGNGEIIVPFDKNEQTSDRKRFELFNEILKKAPHLGVGSPTVGWLRASAKCMIAFRRREAGPAIKLPCLIIAAGADRLVSTPAIEEFASRCRACGYIEIAGAQHELMMEADLYRDQFWAAFDAFVPGSDYEPP